MPKSRFYEIFQNPNGSDEVWKVLKASFLQNPLNLHEADNVYSGGLSYRDTCPVPCVLQLSSLQDSCPVPLFCSLEG